MPLQTSPRVLDLVEWSPSRFGFDVLSVDQAIQITQTAGPRIKVTWSDPASRFIELESKGWVGTIRCGLDLAIRVVPRFPLERFFQILNWLDYPLPAPTTDAVSIAFAQDADQQLVARFVHLLQRIVAVGLHKGYVRRPSRGQHLRGHLLVRETATLHARGHVELAYEEHVLTSDIFVNHAVLWTAYVLLSREALATTARANLASLFRAIGQRVSLLPVRPEEFSGILYDSQSERYRELHELCRLILEGSSPELGVGMTQYYSFGVDTSTLFHIAVTKALRSLPARFKSEPQHTTNLIKGLNFYVDNAVFDRSDGSVAAVLDAKYKDPLKLDTADIQQVVAYAAGTRSKLAFLVYPLSVGLPQPITVGDIQVSFLALDLSQPVITSAANLCKMIVSEIVVSAQATAGASPVSTAGSTDMAWVSE